MGFGPGSVDTVSTILSGHIKRFERRIQLKTEDVIVAGASYTTQNTPESDFFQKALAVVDPAGGNSFRKAAEHPFPVGAGEQMEFRTGIGFQKSAKSGGDHDPVPHSSDSDNQYF